MHDTDSRMSKIEQCFDEKGNLKFDPYRDRDHPQWHDLFADDSSILTYQGCLLDLTGLRMLIESKGWDWKSDAVGLYHADQLGRNTKGSYPTVYYFR